MLWPCQEPRHSCRGFSFVTFLSVVLLHVDVAQAKEDDMICCNKGDTKSAIVLIVLARTTGRYYTNIEHACNAALLKQIGMTSFVSGKRKEGETLIQTFCREAMEETGLQELPEVTVLTEVLVFEEHPYDVTVGYVVVDDEFDGQPVDDDVVFNTWLTENEIRALSFEKGETRLETQRVLDLFVKVRKEGAIV